LKWNEKKRKWIRLDESALKTSEDALEIAQEAIVIGNVTHKHGLLIKNLLGIFIQLDIEKVFGLEYFLQLRSEVFCKDISGAVQAMLNDVIATRLRILVGRCPSEVRLKSTKGFVESVHEADEAFVMQYGSSELEVVFVDGALFLVG